MGAPLDLSDFLWPDIAQGRQPQGYSELSDIAKSLGFTHVFNSAVGTPQPGFGPAVNAIPGVGVAGRSVNFTGTVGDNIPVLGNPFNSNRGTWLWIESGIDNIGGNGQALINSRIELTPIAEEHGLQVRVIYGDILVIEAQTAVTLTAASARHNDGALNVSAFSLEGNSGRHALFNNGFLVASGSPFSAYSGTTNGIGGGADCPPGSIKIYAFAYSPLVIADREIVKLTKDPWQLFKSRSLPLFVPAAAGGGATISTTPGNCSAAGVAAIVSQATIIPTVSATAQASGVTASLTSAVTIPTTPGNAQASGIAASIIRATNIATASGLANAGGVQAIISTSNSILTSSGNASASGVTASLATQITIATTPGNANAGGVQAAILSNLFTLPGDAQASGVSALITYATPHTITARPGNAYATGSRISIPGIFYVGLASPITQEADLIGSMLLASLESAPLHKAVALASTIGL